MKDCLVLEISRQANQLAMSIFKQSELALTLRHYSHCSVSFAEINQLCQEVAAILNKPKGGLETLENLQKAGQVLWDHLLTRQIKDKLKDTFGGGLALSLDEDLINIPWELLYDGKEFLALKFNLGRLVRTKQQISPVQYRSINLSHKMLILANPTGDLKSAYLEGVYIKNQFAPYRNKVGIDFKSTNIDTLYLKKNLRDYDLVHFAGHCEYDNDNPQNTGWVLSDRVFNTQDIMTLAESLSLPTLVFANACQSAKMGSNLIENDYQRMTYSLASAFLFSGVRLYIGTLRKIEDPVSLVFAREFYLHLLRDKSVGEALRLARLKLIKEDGVQALSWASYVLYGDPNFVFLPLKNKPALGEFKKQYKKALKLCLLLVTTISICVYLYMWLPSLNPNAYILFRKSQILFSKGKNQETISLANSLIKKDPLFLAAYPLLAEAYQRLGRPDNALECYFDYVVYSQKKHDNKSLNRAYIDIGWVYYQKGNFAKAEDFYQKAITLAQQNNDRLNEALALRKLALWHLDKEEYVLALELLLKSSVINYERQGNLEHRYNLACDYFDIALVFTDRDDMEAAKKFYDKSLKLFEGLKLEGELSDYYFNLGEIFKFQKQYQKALEYYSQGLKIDEALSNLPAIVSDYDMLGEFYVEMGNLEEAEKCFNQAVKTGQPIDAPLELASVYYNLGLLSKQKGHINRAREYFRQAQEIYRKSAHPALKAIQQEFSDLNN